VNHLEAVRALEKAGFAIARQGKHIIMTDGKHVLTIPRHNPIKLSRSTALFASPA
jgi:predicted RNA binding protein YcfA (HicA-like mRNA interferase family)